MIEASFGPVGVCEDALVEPAPTQFYAGCARRIRDGRRVSVIKIGNADNSLVVCAIPLLVIDEWGHAHYLDYQNRLKGYVVELVGKLVNWKFAASNLA